MTGRRQPAGLWPREHGAYVQLLGPLLTALVFVRPAPASLAWAVMAACLFLLHEPVMVLLGRRGQRAKKELGVAAQHRAEWLGAGAGVGGLGGLLLAPLPAALWFGVSIALALVSARLLFHKQERSLRGQVIVSLALASFAMPMLVASQVPGIRAGCLVGTFALTHVLAALTARGAIYRKQDEGRLLRSAALGSVLSVAVLALLHGQVVPLAWSLAPLPFAAVAVALLCGAFAPRSPKPIGWALTGASCVAVLLFGLGL